MGMGCAMGEWKYKEYMEYMEKSGFTEKEAIDSLPPGEVAADIANGNVSKEVLIAAVEAEEYAVNNAAVGKIKTWKVDDVIESGVAKNKNVQDAFAKSGIDVAAMDVAWKDVDLGDAEKVKKYFDARHPGAIAFANDIVEGATTGGQDEQMMLVVLFDTLGEGGLTEFELNKIPGMAKGIEIYKNFYKDPKNVYADTMKVNDGKLTWTDKLGSNHEIDLIDYSGAVYDPRDGKYKSYNPDDPNAFIQQKIVFGDGYSNLTLNKQPYAERLLKYIQDIENDELDPKSKGKGYDEITNKFIEDTNPKIGGNIWTCTGKACTSAEGEESGGGGGGGGGSSGGYTPKPTATENTLFVDTGAVTDADVLADGNVVGKTNEKITLKVGEYVITVKKKGYQDERFVALIAEYPITKQISLAKLPTKINAFLEGIGGVANLTNDHVMYVYCALKETITGDAEWRALARTPTPTITTMIERPTKYDVQYLRKLVLGDTTGAKLLIDEGKVTL